MRFAHRAWSDVTAGVPGTVFELPRKDAWAFVHRCELGRVESDVDDSAVAPIADMCFESGGLVILWGMSLSFPQYMMCVGQGYCDAPSFRQVATVGWR